MTKFLITEEVSEKLRELVNQKFQARGRFKDLENQSGVSASKWKNFLYRKQEATQELIQFWVNTNQDNEFPISKDEGFSIYLDDKDISDRLREFISMRFQARGRFTKLESISGIKANKWKSFYYGKQGASEDLLKFWCNQFPDTQYWILTGNHRMTEEDYSSNESSLQPKDLTIADRLIWIINDWVALDGQKLFDYLAKRSSGKIKADDWEKVIQKIHEPSLEMISIVCEARPYFLEWIINGRVGSLPQADPFDPNSSKRLSLENWINNK